ncbi:hypothetical protein VNI00_016577 [Paramarasmius palmivorus]|uniref:Uncharacterized protein n=1 Tax=Paramarasmius palmivorus TaxID=297713 RepID=A0AAW0BDB0_9AGAR
MVAMLNARRQLRKDHTGTIMSSGHIPVGSLSGHFADSHEMGMLPSPASDKTDDTYGFRIKGE